jgi:NAD(P)-dependent dehydrogenase (short-subunit alcohol dehydrogenase family)
MTTTLITGANKGLGQETADRAAARELGARFGHWPGRVVSGGE